MNKLLGYTCTFMITIMLLFFRCFEKSIAYASPFLIEEKKNLMMMMMIIKYTCNTVWFFFRAPQITNQPPLECLSCLTPPSSRVVRVKDSSLAPPPQGHQVD